MFNMGVLNACIALLVLKMSATSAASNLLDKIKADPDLSQVIFWNKASYETIPHKKSIVLTVVWCRPIYLRTWQYAQQQSAYTLHTEHHTWIEIPRWPCFLMYSFWLVSIIICQASWASLQWIIIIIYIRGAIDLLSANVDTEWLKFGHEWEIAK